MEREIIRRVPCDRADVVKRAFEDAGATDVKVEEKPPGSGKCKVTATFDDEGDE